MFVLLRITVMPLNAYFKRNDAIKKDHNASTWNFYSNLSAFSGPGTVKGIIVKPSWVVWASWKDKLDIQGATVT